MTQQLFQKIKSSIALIESFSYEVGMLTNPEKSVVITTVCNRSLVSEKLITTDRAEIPRIAIEEKSTLYRC